MKRRKGIFRSAVSMLLAAMLCISMLPVGAYAAGTVSGADMAEVPDGKDGAVLEDTNLDDTAGLDRNDGHFIMSLMGMQPMSMQSGPMKSVPNGAAMLSTGGSDITWTVAEGAFVPKNGTLSTTFNPSAPLTVQTPQGRVKVSKTAKATENENEFEVTLNMTTEDVVMPAQTSSDVAITLVFDKSSSMNVCPICGNPGNWHTTKNRLGHTFKKSITNPTLDKCYYIKSNNPIIRCEKSKAEHGIKDHASASPLVPAKESVCRFIDSLASSFDPGTHVQFSAVCFSSTVTTMSFKNSSGTSTNWLDITNPTNLANVKTGIMGLSCGGFTDLASAFKRANTLMKKTDVSTIPKQNKFVVLLSDGVPEGYGSATDPSIDGLEQADVLRESCNRIDSLFIVHAGNDSEACYDYNKNKITPKEYLELFSTSVYMPDGENDAANNISDAFEAIGKSLSNRVTSWSVTDPMGAGITFKRVTSGQSSSVASCSGGTLNWNLKADTPVKSGNTNAYQLKYLVEVTPPSSGCAEGDVIPLNGYTSLSYAIINDKGQMVDEGGNVKADQVNLDTIAFNVPGVMASALDPETSGFELPKTGGIGTGPVYVAGIVAMLACLGLPVGRRRRRKQVGDHFPISRTA